MMFPLDNEKSGYTWNSQWIHPYESAWNICEKFRAANVPEASQNKALGIKSNGVKANFSDSLDVYVRGVHNGILEDKFIEQYGMEKYKWHFYQLSTRNQDYPNVDKYIHELTAGLFLMKEVLDLSHIDMIYLYDVSLMPYEKDSVYNEYIAAIKHFVFYANNKEQLNEDLFTYLYSELLCKRYQHILSELQTGLLSSYQQVGKYLPHTNVYPTYILIEYTKGLLSYIKYLNVA